MINPSELRVGNRVLDSSKTEITIESITDTGINLEQVPSHSIISSGNNLEPEYEFKHLAPIPITEDCLVKAGFEKESHGYFWLSDDIALKLEVDLWLFYVNDKQHDHITWVKDIEDWHHLQNLVYFLTGKELD